MLQLFGTYPCILHEVQQEDNPAADKNPVGEHQIADYPAADHLVVKVPVAEAPEMQNIKP